MKLINKTKAELVKIAQDLRDEATGWHQQAKKLQDSIDAGVDGGQVLAESWQQAATSYFSETIMLQERIDRMGKAKPYKLMALAFTAGVLVTAIAVAVL